MKKYFPKIGLEVHIELNTVSKMFCQCKADYFKKTPNSEVCPVCLGLPGALPVPNIKAIQLTQIVGMALGCKLNKNSRFDRKHYFYPDLPKGYQISQYEQPFAIEGEFYIKNKKIRIRRVHLEEDTGKLIHKTNETLIDFNRSGVPLVEIVTEPDFDNPTDVKIYLEYLHLLVKQYLKVSNANLEEGSMRLEPNISLSDRKETLPNYKVEVKNINSFKYVEKAINFEIKRQETLLNSKVLIKNETRGFNENKNITFSQRTKEEAKDYRYFPEPDIPPFYFTDKDFALIKIPELPYDKYKRFIKQYKLTEAQARVLINNVKKADYYEKLVSELDGKIDNLKIANYIINKVQDTDLDYTILKNNVINYFNNFKIDTGSIITTIKQVLKDNPKAVKDYKSGKQNAIFYILGKIIQKIGNLDTNTLKKLIIEEISK